jgi:hypothetical protein
VTGIDFKIARSMIKKPRKEDISIVVFANRKDFCLTKVCIASIRYYYPHVEILLVKDKLNGNFSTRRLCRSMNVQVLKMPPKYYGWGAAKIHFLLNKNIPSKRFLCLDSDIIFVGRVLEKFRKMKQAFIVSPDQFTSPGQQNVGELYIDEEKVKVFYPQYEYPGYFFNTGQMVATPGMIPESLFNNSFVPHRYPYYKNREAFPLVDQAVLNVVLPIFSAHQHTEIGKVDFMKWSGSFFQDQNHARFDTFKDGETTFLVHYAGDLRTHKLDQMKGADLLHNFHRQYFSTLSPMERWMDTLQDKVASIKFVTSTLFKWNRLKIALFKL